MSETEEAQALRKVSELAMRVGAEFESLNKRLRDVTIAVNALAIALEQNLQTLVIQAKINEEQREKLVTIEKMFVVPKDATRN